MKKLLLTLLPLLFFTSLLIAQVPEGTIITFGFYKVEDGKQAEYETVMKDYIGEAMKERIKNGCMENWIFRRVLPNTSASNYFTLITVDVFKPGKTNRQCEGVTNETVFPEMSEGIIDRTHHGGQRVIQLFLIYQSLHNRTQKNLSLHNNMEAFLKKPLCPIPTKNYFL